MGFSQLALLLALILQCVLSAEKPVNILPVVDISPLVQHEGPADCDTEKCVAVLKEIKKAFAHRGIFSVVGHGWEPDLIPQAFEASQRLFHLNPNTLADLQEQGALAMKSNVQRGFLPKLVTGGGYNMFALGCEDEKCRRDREQDPSMGASDLSEKDFPNIWPSEEEFPRHYRDTLVKVFSAQSVLAKLLSAQFLSKRFKSSIYDDLTLRTALRLFHYPQTDPNEIAQGAMGQGSHTDEGLMTFILQDEVGGLEYQHFGRWYPVVPVPGAIVVNGGNWIHKLRPELIDPVHRVLSPSTQERFSFVFLYQMSIGTLERHTHDWLRDL